VFHVKHSSISAEDPTKAQIPRSGRQHLALKPTQLPKKPLIVGFIQFGAHVIDQKDAALASGIGNQPCLRQTHCAGDHLALATRNRGCR
jgi:hypothetical protein